MTEPILPLSGASFGANPSFVDLLREARPSELAHLQQAVSSDIAVGVPHGTTVLGLIYADGVLVAGDRRATAGYTIAVSVIAATAGKVAGLAWSRWRLKVLLRHIAAAESSSPPEALARGRPGIRATR